MNYADIAMLLKDHGYLLDRIVRFKHHDRIHWHDSEVRVTLTLRKHIEDFTKEQLEREL